ncbi:MAG: efflux RND transporter periplasmic adaptor subunit [Phycisphaerae bacterium]|nr:efflux RND transporter periplasmic adaptor subunit [Phycisphaerae bacterium]
MNKSTKVIVQILIVVLVLTGGFFGAKKLISMKKAPVKKPPMQYLPLVMTTEVKKYDEAIIVKGFGTVKSKKQVDLVPQVAGKAEFVNASLVNGGFVKANETLVQIEKIDFELQVQQATAVKHQSEAAISQSEAAVVQAQLKLEQEQAESDIAKLEWQQLNPDKDIAKANPLALRIPQLKTAKAALDSANAQLDSAKAQLESAISKYKMAQLNYERTELSVPFDGCVISENIDPGQMVTMGKTVAVIYSTEKMEIVVPLEDNELQWFDVPGINNTDGAKVDVYVDFQGKEDIWHGKVIRSEGIIDSNSRMVNVVIEVDKPFAYAEGKSPLMPGMFVRVQIHGRTVDNIVRLPDRCLHNGNELWIAKDNKLEIIRFEADKIVRRDKDYIYLKGVLQEGQQVISSQLDATTEGMMVLMEGQDRQAVLKKLMPDVYEKEKASKKASE